ncbi:MAG TPA: glycosyltransferase family 2 protein [Stellaceae bacterium]|nr:glycosyltransferase family 2 protein [Stellaceae bacterium]
MHSSKAASGAPAPRPILDPRNLAVSIRYARENGVRATLARVRQRLTLKPPYDAWVAHYDTLRARDRRAILAHLAALERQPTISVVMPVYNTRPAFLRNAIGSVVAQLYPHWELCIADDASTKPEIRAILEEAAAADPRIKVVFRPRNGHISAASNSALALAEGEFIAPMDHDDELPAHALYMVAVELDGHPDADMIYSDEDKIDAEGRRRDPYFKPDWSPTLFHSQNMISHLGVYRAALVREVGGFREGFEGSQDYDLALRVSVRTEPARIRHIPHVLYHWRLSEQLPTFSTDNASTALGAAHRALAEHLGLRGERPEIVPSAVPSYWRVRRALPAAPPRVSLIVPTRDRVELLRTCIDGLLHGTRYPDREIIVVDNDSREPDTLAYLDALRAHPEVRVLRVEGEFNFSALNNRAAATATGELVGFINNDIEVIHADWLEEMVAQALQPGVGAVGAKLYYGDDTIQHAGVVLGLGGIAGHVHRKWPRGSPGYFGLLQIARDVSCVTAACMVMWKTVFDEVGGFDEVNLRVALNDVDLCIKVREAGYRLVWTPDAELYHHESASRGSDLRAANFDRFTRERAYMKKRWGALLRDDPYFNPNLSLTSEHCTLAFPPRAAKPWAPYKARGGRRSPA